MIQVGYVSSFVKAFNDLEPDLQEEVIQKIELFRDRKNHRQLGVHKLRGKLADRYAFSVNYKIRVVFHYLNPDTVNCVAVGDHDVYKS